MFTKQQYQAAEKMLRSQDEEIRSLGISIFEADEKFKNTYLTDANIYIEKWLSYASGLVLYCEPVIQKNNYFFEYMPPYEYYLIDKHHAPTGRVRPSN